jgi:poly-gamma-glutamate synthesis protein (capsule biosynthesis protein)
MKASDAIVSASLAVCVALIAFGIGWGGGAQALRILGDQSTQTASVLDSVNFVDHVSSPAPASLSVIMVGDIMFDRHIRAIALRDGYDSLFASTTAFFKTADIAVANLEGPVTSNASKTLLSDGVTTHSFAFTFATSSVISLANAGINLVSLANNHVDNFGLTGFAETKKWLDLARVGHFGDPWNDEGSESVITKNGIQVAFVGYHAFSGGEPAFDRILSDVKRLSVAGYFVVVMPHWGEEYTVHSSDALRAKAQAFVDAGAGAVIGSHPHVIMDHEILKNPSGVKVPVFYSLGNFIFDQYFSPDVMKGNMVELFLEKGTQNVTSSVLVAPSIHLSKIRVYDVSLTSHQGPTILFDTMHELDI